MLEGLKKAASAAGQAVEETARGFAVPKIEERDPFAFPKDAPPSERCEWLAEFIEKRAGDRFDHGTWYHAGRLHPDYLNAAGRVREARVEYECGTQACVAGWAAIFGGTAHRFGDWKDAADTALGITAEERDRAGVYGLYSAGCGNPEADRKNAARNLRKMAAYLKKEGR